MTPHDRLRVLSLNETLHGLVDTRWGCSKLLTARRPHMRPLDSTYAPTARLAHTTREHIESATRLYARVRRCVSGGRKDSPKHPPFSSWGLESSPSIRCPIDAQEKRACPIGKPSSWSAREDSKPLTPRSEV